MDRSEDSVQILQERQQVPYVIEGGVSQVEEERTKEVVD